ncbi:MAG TPA: AraC family transcriptional regulator [Thermoanaerobaculia bacterium]|nr:AraC family transcriptional regulator [Thermoanaerobaculia bacterium]
MTTVAETSVSSLAHPRLGTEGLGLEPPPMPRIFIRRPTGALAPFVDTIWYFTSCSFGHERERILPTGAMQLLVNLEEDELRTYHGPTYQQVERLPGAALSGTYRGHFAIDTAEQRSIAGVAFRSGGAFPFFREPADEVAGAHVELGALWGGGGATLRERLLEAGPSPVGAGGAKGPQAILDTLERELLARAVRPLASDPTLEFAVSAFDRGATVAAVLSRIGGSSRRFLRAFAERVGLTPKRFERIRRFRRVVDSIELGRPVSWAQVALACGYYDQAHLINDFREFSGITPTEYAPRSYGDRSHVPLRDETSVLD